MSAHYYIYYRLSPDHVVVAEQRVREMQSELHGTLGIRGRFLTKRDEALLRMEIYEEVSDTALFESTLRNLVRKHHLEQVVQPGATRHLECFLE